MWIGYLPIMPVNARDSPGTSRDKQGKAGTSRDKAGKNRGLSLLVPVCPCLPLLVLVCPCLSLSYLVCPGLSLYASTLAIISCLPLEMNITVFISMSIFTLTFLAKPIVPMHANSVCNFFFTFHLASLITLSVNPNSSILVINIKKGSTWFLSCFFFFFSVNYCKKLLLFSIFLMNIKGLWFK